MTRELCLKASAIVSVAVSGCGTGNDLSGSIGEAFSLDFDRVQIRKQDQTLLVEYLKDIPGGVTKPCKVVVNPPTGQNADFSPNFVLEENGFISRVFISRVAPDGGEFPDRGGGRFILEKIRFSEGGNATGEFETVFRNGRTLSGSFKGRIKEVPLN